MLAALAQGTTGSLQRLCLARTDFSRIFLFHPPDFLRGFCRQIFAPHFCEKKRLEKSSRKIPGKILQNLYNKNPRHTFLQFGRVANHCYGVVFFHGFFADWQLLKCLRQHYFQRKTKGQQLKGKIVSEFFTLSAIFHFFFHNFTTGLSPSKQKVLAQEKQRRKKNRTSQCCTLVVARLSSSSIWQATSQLHGFI